MRREPCPQTNRHTPAPAGYVAWHSWAETMAKTHRQTRCPICRLFVIWTPKETTDATA